MRLLAPLLAALLTFSTPAMSLAQDASKEISKTQFEADRQVVEQALMSGSFDKIRAQAPQLEAVVSRAPASWPAVEHRPDLTIVRLNNPGATLSVLLNAAGKMPAGSGKVSAEFNVYGMAAFLLGSLAMEKRDLQTANRWLDRGLSFQPDNLLLVTEKGLALVIAKRFEDALALYDRQDRRDAFAKSIDPNGEARLLRARGFALIELNRLSEAEAAYEQALAIEPDHGGAKSELAYIRKLRAGAAATGTQIVTGDKAKTEQPHR